MKDIRLQRAISRLMAVMLLAMSFCCGASAIDTHYVCAAETNDVAVGDYFFIGDPDAEGFTGLPLWRAVDKDADDNLYLMSEYLWTSEDEDSFIQFGTIASEGTPMEGYEDLGYMSKGSAWQGSMAQTWCRAFEEKVLAGAEGLIIKAITRTDREFTSPDATESTDDAYIKFAWTRDILKEDRVFFLSAEEAAAYMPTPDERAAYLHDGKNLGECKDYWLRSPRLFTISECAGKVFAYGKRRGMIGRQVVESLGAARPAFWADAASELSQYKCLINYKWNSDYTSCTASLEIDGTALISETAVSASTIIKDSTDLEEGTVEFTANFNNRMFERQTMRQTIARKPAQVTPQVIEIQDLPAVKISKPKPAKKKVTVKWKKVSKKNLKKIQGIEISIVGAGIDKSLTAGKKKTSKKISGLQSRQKYTIKVRAYRWDGNVKHVSAWKSKTVIIK